MAAVMGVAMLPMVMMSQAPSAPGPGAPPAVSAGPVFPAVNPKYFTATSPTVETVNAFLKEIWGFDANRVWSVAAIQATNAPGVSKVVVFIGDKTQGAKTQQMVFFTTPDGKHAIADNVIEFGPQPFAATRELLKARADGPARGAAGKGLMLVEFTDLQCPHCKDAAPIMEQLATDFPQARVVLENFPLVEIHPQAFEAAAVGVCVRKGKGDEAFFKYAQAVFDTQGALTPTDVDATLSAAVTKVGGDPAAMLACAKEPATIENVKASMDLAKAVGADGTPALYINGFPIPINGVPYEMLKRIVAFRGSHDGVPVTVQPSLKSLK